MSLNRLLQPLPIGGSSLVRDYLDEVPAALSFYAASPWKLDSYRAKLREVSARFDRSRRERLARALHPTSARAADRLARFVEQGGALVTTGQQTGFLTGPLYTIYKALSAVALSRHLEEQLGTIVLPVFWSASEDHDWAEVNHAYLLDPAGRLRRFELPGSDPRPLPMAKRVLEGDMESLCDDVIQYVGAQHLGITHVREIVDPYRVGGAGVAEAFQRAMASVLSSFDALLTDAADPVVKDLSREVLAVALLEAGQQEEELAARSHALLEAGYAPQVSILEGGTNVFLQTESGRERVYRRNGRFFLRERRVTLDRESVTSEVDSEPGRFSPNVLLRPVVESAVFPTLAYVGGPGELAYFAQAGTLFDAYGISPPLAVPRFSGILVEAAVARTLRKLNLDQDDLHDSRDRLLERLARRRLPVDAEAALGRIREDAVRGFEKLAEEVAGVDGTLVGAIERIRNQVLLDSRRAERTIVRAIKRSDTLTTARLDRVLDSLRPMSSPQDRVLNVLPFLARYGHDFLKAVEESIRESWRLPS